MKYKEGEKKERQRIKQATTKALKTLTQRNNKIKSS